MTDLEQFVLELDVPTITPPALSQHVPAGAGRLLRRLVKGGLDPDALQHAAAIVAYMDREPTA